MKASSRDREKTHNSRLNTPIQAITGSCMKARPKAQLGSKLQSFYKRERHLASEKNISFLN